MKDIFKGLIQKNNLAHSYLFFGEDINEQKLTALWIARTLEQNPRTLSDSLIIEPTEESIGIDRVRELKKFLWQKPIYSPKRTAIINQANCLTLEAQNAILKIAEEPPLHSLIILTAKDPGLLAATLVSRFHKIYFPPKATKPIINPMVQDLAKSFLKDDHRQRREIIKKLIDKENNNGELEQFVALLMMELHKNPTKNWQSLKALAHRWQLIQQLNVNKRLQLEAWMRTLE